MHGGDLASARRLFPGAPEPFLDLSTGISPLAYPIPPLPAEVFTRLPEPAAAEALAVVAAARYGATAAGQVVPAPGTQILLPRVAALLPPGRAAVLSPTYAEHARAAAAAGHAVEEVTDPTALAEADLAVVVNPNNPDGRILPKRNLLALAERLRARGGLLVVDEAFMDVGPEDESLTDSVGPGGLVVLRSFGKFFGLAGLRLGFAIAAETTAARLRDALGPWAVAGPALAVGRAALADRAWIAASREALRQRAARLDGLLLQCGLQVVGGTALFRLVRSPEAADLFQRLGRAGILVRRFPERPEFLRFGLPDSEEDWRRLTESL